MTDDRDRSAPLRLAAFYGGIFLVMGIYGPFWPLWLKAKGLSPENIGLVFALGTLAKLSVTPFVARHVDRRGTRKKFMIGLALAGAGAFVVFPFTNGLADILAVTIVYFVFWGPLMPLQESLTMLTRSVRAFDYGRVRLWGSITFIIGAFGGGILLKGRPADWIHWAILITIGLTAAAALALPDTRHAPAAPDGRPFRDVIAVPGMWQAVTAATLVQASHIVYYNFGSIHWTNADQGKDVIGLLWAEGVVAEIILFSFAAAVVARIGALRLIMIGAAAAAVRWLGTGATTDIGWLIPLQAMHALSFGATHLGIIHLIAERVPLHYSATAQSLYAMVMGLGFSLGSFTGGYLFGWSPAGAFWAMAAFGAGGILFALWAGAALRGGAAAPAGN
ncbi:MAG: MFS transporter [Rhodospirillaceae bacterium]